MKVAVCISGIFRGETNRNLMHIRSHFPYDTFYATWKQDSCYLKDTYFYDEPKMDYHPIKDIKNPKGLKLRLQKEGLNNGTYGKDFYDRTLHHTKQILIHDMLLKDIPEEYDMIIRARFDTYLSPNVSFNKYLAKSYNENIAIGFGTRTSRHRDINIMKEVPRIYPEGKDPDVSQDWGWYLMDPLIIHPRKLWNHDLVQKLHEDKELAAAEWGWYQILSEPYEDSHLSVYGGAQIEKYL